ncbi:S8 family serine peptidase [Niallia sp. NCCP-28]|uniref:S8 family serine peptidase n=1 Tax=Niallia sp. NCCP-28 TaxID=2934712 RepID=UPI00208BFF2D|nr:S8 family serine peptidase [Niallia sp. NCCP-28]GKU83524.1 hypothetical protein NCCP28_29200 [Niallia sp. NCCP-28]
MKKIMGLFFFVVLLIFSSSVSAEEMEVESKISKFNTKELFDAKKDFNAKELVIKFKKNVSEKKRWEILLAARLKEDSYLKGFSLVKTTSDEDLKTLADTLLKKKEIEFVEPNYKIKASYTPKDSNYNKQWYLKKINTEKAWNTTKGSSAITIAVLDAGMQTGHPEFKGRITNPYNAVTGGNSLTPSSHGTHVAGILAAANDNKGTVGVAPNVNIMPVDIFDGEFADTYDEATGLIYAADKGANIINMSFGSKYYAYAEAYAIQYAASKGVVLIAAAGNDASSKNYYPAGYDSVISVAATDESDHSSYYSNYGSSIDISAPGDDIYSTVPNNKYGYMSGTSMATPIVSGTAALVLSKNPLLSATDVKNILIKSTKDLGANGWDYLFGYGRIDAEKAVKNTPAPFGTLSVDTIYKIKGNNKLKFSVPIYKGTKVTARIENSQKKTIRTIISNKTWNGGKLSSSWDGKDDKNDFAADGKYTLVVKATNGKETVHQTKEIKVINEIKPIVTISGSSSISFSPAIKNKGTTSFNLNKSAKVEAKITASKGKTVKTLLSQKSLAKGNHPLTWDGKNNSNNVVPDGTYQLFLSAVDMHKQKADPKKLKMIVDTKGPDVKEKLAFSIFKLDGQKQQTATMELTEQAEVSVFIKTDKGTTVTKITASKIIKAGKTLFYWNGRTDKNTIVPEGKYYYYYEAKDKVGNIIKKKGSLFTIQNWQKPIITVNPTFYYKTKGNLTIPFTASKDGTAKLEIYNGSVPVESMQKQVAQGAQSMNWDGTDKNGKILNDGTYQLKFTLVDKYKQTTTQTAKLIVGLEPIAIKAPAIVQYDYNNPQKIDVFYRISHNAAITINILDSNNELVKIIQNNKLQNPGISKFS